MLVVGLVLAYYGYAVTKNPHIWGDQGRDAIKEEVSKTHGYYVSRKISTFILAWKIYRKSIFNFKDIL